MLCVDSKEKVKILSQAPSSCVWRESTISYPPCGLFCHIAQGRFCHHAYALSTEGFLGMICRIGSQKKWSMREVQHHWLKMEWMPPSLREPQSGFQKLRVFRQHTAWKPGPSSSSKWISNLPMSRGYSVIFQHCIHWLSVWKFWVCFF